jgi:hypothetical protein
MNSFGLILISRVGLFFGPVSTFLSSLSDAGIFMLMGAGGLAIAFAATLSQVDILEAVLADVKKWHGKIEEQFKNIDNVYDILSMYALPAWNVPSAMIADLKLYRDRLQLLISACSGTHATQADRMQRDVLLKEAVSYCLIQVRMWAYNAYAQGNMTIDALHSLRFLLPGETSGYRGRSVETNVEAEVKAHPVSADIVRVVIDQSAGENAAQVVHGWPTGVRHALLVITTEDGKEVYREITPRLHNNITMPEGSHGKLFLAKASFLKHTNDTPRFVNQASFTMPYLTEDIASLVEKVHEEDAAQHRLEVERFEAEIRRLKG